MATAERVALVTGSRYSLANSVPESDLSVLHVKLTDSALRAIEEFHKSKDGNKHASIQFQGNQGVISIPARQTLPNGEDQRTFAFTLASLLGDQKDGSIQCIQHSCKQGNQILESLGPLSQKLTIQATDDVYQMTLEKMNQAEQDSKKACTKEIKVAGPGSGRGKRIYKKTMHNELTRPKFTSTIEPPRRDNSTGPPPGGHNISNLKRTLPLAEKTKLLSNVQKVLSAGPPNERITNHLGVVRASGIRKQMQAFPDLSYTSPAISPCHGSPMPTVKNPSPAAADDISLYPTQPPKKQRVSHVKKELSKQTESKPSQPRATNGVCLQQNGPLSGLTHPGAAPTLPTVPSLPTAPTSVPVKLEDYKSIYKPITDKSQRCKYKEDFNIEYEEYLQLHRSVLHRLRPLNQLIEAIQQEVADNTPEYESLKRKICDEHLALKSNPEHEAERSHCDYLHKKLAYIKQLVHDYDTSRLAASQK